MIDPSTKHPSYWKGMRSWEICRDNFEGQEAMKESRSSKVNELTSKPLDPYLSYKYIKPTAGQIADGLKFGEDGYVRFRSYVDRALHSDFVSDAVDMYLGISWTKPPEINLGILESLYGEGKPITREGESIEQLYLRVNVEQWVAGRVGLLVDLPEGENTLYTPYVSVYDAEAIINWDAGSRTDISKEHLNVVVLDESGQFRNVLEWKWKEQYRVLWLGELESNQAEGSYKVAVVKEGNNLEDAEVINPKVEGRELDEIPFVIINTKAVGTKIEKPPLLGLSYMTTDLFRLDADYKNALHNQGADTLFTKMAEDGEVKGVGAGAHINLSNPQGEAKFIGVDSAGLPSLENSVENAKKLASKKAGELIADDSRDRESASALEQRIGTKTQTLAQLVMTCAEGIQKTLRLIAKWKGATDSQIAEITVKPNLQFAPKDLDSAALLALSQAAEINPLINMREQFEHLKLRGLFKNKTWEQAQLDMAESKILKEKLSPEKEKEGSRESGSTKDSSSSSSD